MLTSWLVTMGLGAATLGSPAPQPLSAPPTSEVERWEHRCMELHWTKATDLETFANSMGLAGWELVGFPRPDLLCFKRRALDPRTAQGRLRQLNDRMSKLTLIYNQGHIGEKEYRKRLDAIERERVELLARPESF